MGGSGQGTSSFTSCFQLAVYVQLTAGAGGAGGNRNMHHLGCLMQHPEAAEGFSSMALDQQLETVQFVYYNVHQYYGQHICK